MRPPHQMEVGVLLLLTGLENEQHVWQRLVPVIELGFCEVIEVVPLPLLVLVLVLVLLPLLLPLPLLLLPPCENLCENLT